MCDSHFFAISGYLFFVKADTLQDIWKNMKKRIITLFIPFIIWNVIYFVLFYFIDFYPDGIGFYEYLDVTPGLFGWINKIIHILLLFEYNAVGWYMFVLLGFVCISPVLHYTLKNKYLSVLCLVVFLIIGFFEPIPLMKGKNYTLFFFYLGAFVSKYANVYINKRRSYKELIFAFMVFVVSQIMVGIYGFYTEIQTYIPRFVFEILIAISVWFLLDFVPQMESKGYYKYSFAIYLTHPIILSVLKLAVSYTPLINMGTIIPIYLFEYIKKKTPKGCIYLTGGR